MLKNTICLIVVLSACISLQSIAADHDYDGDKHADIIFRNIAPDDLSQVIVPSTLYVEVEQTIATTVKNTLGEEASDIPVSGDFDGDGLWDYGVFRPSTSQWIIHNSTTSETSITIFDQGQTVMPVPADYDGDGVTDLALRNYLNFTWYILNSTGIDSRTLNDDGISRVVFGRNSSDTPVPADYDGDDKADIAVRRASSYTWYIQNSSGSNFNSQRLDGIQRVVFGRDSNDIAVPADYNGDGIDDVAVRRPSSYTWYIRNSDNSNYNSDRGDGIQRIVFGRDPNDIPLVADYDGDAIADIAVLRNSNGTVYIKNSSGTAYNSARGDGIQRVRFTNTKTSYTEGSLLPLAQNPGEIFSTVTAAIETENNATMPTASYKVVFRTFFDAEHFPTQLPGNPHFSRVVGMTHKDGVELWDTSGIASDGIEIMAESGGTNRLLDELELAISQSLAEFSILGSGLGSNPDSAEFQFTITEGFPLVSLVTMVAPSPDWFIGVKNLSLKDANGHWLSEVHVPLPTYDAGTDNGDTFVAGNSDTNPRQPIQLLTTNPEYTDFLNGFQRTTGQAIASFTFVLQ